MKDAYYFSHDSNARHDPAMAALTLSYGMQGYGMYWMVVEMLREQSNYKLPMKPYIYAALAKDMMCTPDQVKDFIESCIDEYDLFESDGEYFWSNSLLRRMEKYEDKKYKRTTAGKRSGEVRRDNANTPKEEYSDKPQVYLIKCYNYDEQFYKIGSTSTTISRRFSGKMPYSYEVISQIFIDKPTGLETEIGESLKDFQYEPSEKFPGNNECYEINPKVVRIFTSFEHSSNIGEHRPTKESKVKESKVNKKKEEDTNDPTDRSVEKPAKSTKDKDLYNKIKAAFLSQNDNFTNWGKEGKAIWRLEEYARIRAPDKPEEFIHQMIEKFWQLKQSGDKFWKGQPFLPSALGASGIFDRVLEQFRSEEVPDELKEYYAKQKAERAG